MQRNPFWNQQATKTRSKRKIVMAIKEKPSTFGELRKKTSLSKVTLTKYLDELKNEEMIQRAVNGQRIEYSLTAKGKTIEQQFREGMTEALGILRPLIHNSEAAKSIHDFASLAKEEPELAEGLMQFLAEYLPIMFSDDMKYWIHTHGKKDAIKILEKELIERLQQSAKPKTSAESPTRDTLTVFQDLLDAMRQILAANNPRRH